jgi:predicted RNase H-like HicB family nuclease
VISKKEKGMPRVEQKYKFPVIIEKDQDGYFVSCPQIQGCYSQGDTYEEAMKNIREAIRAHIQESLANKEPLSRTEDIAFASLEIAV